MLKQLLLKYKQSPVQMKASFAFLICAFLQRGISTLTTPIFTRLMSTLEYGQYNVFNSWLSIISVFVTLNLTAGVYVQGLVKFSDERKKFCSSMQGLSCTLSLIWFVVYSVLHQYINNLLHLTTIQVICLFCLMWAGAAFGFWAAEQRVEYNYRKLVTITLLVSIFKPLISIIAISNFNDKVNARIISLTIVELVAYLGPFISQLKKGKQFYNKRIWVYALKFNIPLIPHYLSQNLLNSADRIMIERLVGGSEAGIYSLAYSISLVLTIFNTALMQTIEPWLYTKIKDEDIFSISKIVYPALIAIAGINLGLIAFSPEIILFFAPAEFYDAKWVIPPVAMSVFYLFLYNFFACFEFYFEQNKLITVATLLEAILNVILNYIFIPIFGYIAAAYTTLICYFLYALFHFIAMTVVCNRYLDKKKPYNAKILALISIFFHVAGFLIMITYDYYYIRYTVIILTLIIVFIMRKNIIRNVRQIIDVKASH